MTLNEIKKQFLSQYAISSEATKNKYKKDLNLFLDVCNIKTIDELEKFKECEFEVFYEYAQEQGWKPSTTNQRLGIAKMFTEWCFKKHIISNNFLEDIKRVRSVNFVHYAPSKCQTEQLIEYIKEHTDKKRLYLMTKLVFMCGLRRMEVCNLKIEDLNKENSTIKVFGKGKKIVEQPIPSHLMIELIEYINTEREDIINKYLKLGGKDKGYIFLSGIGDKVNAEKKDLSNGNRVNDNVFYQQIKRYAKLAKLSNPDKVTPHAVRRTFVTNVYEKSGGDLLVAQNAARHSNSSTTEQCYIDFNRDRVKDTVNNLFDTEKNKNVPRGTNEDFSEDDEYKLYILLKKKYAQI